MSLLSQLRSAAAALRAAVAGRRGQADAKRDAVLVFASTGEVIRAQQVLEAAGFAARVMGPPPALQTGCDMVIVVPLIHAFAASTALTEADLDPLKTVTAGEALLKPVSLFMVKDYGRWLMVRAANMKITAEKDSGRIVNVSGGGCPDVPWLAAQLTGVRAQAAEPLLRRHGQTLCGYALLLAQAELVRRLDSPDTAKAGT